MSEVENNESHTPIKTGLEGVKEILSGVAAEADTADDQERAAVDEIVGDGEAQPSESDLRDLELADEFEESSSDDDENPTKLEFLKDLAEKAGIDPKDLYSLKIALDGDDEPITLGDLKDQRKDFQNVEQAREQVSVQREDFENEMIRAKAELQEVIGLLPELPPELIKRAVAQRQDHVDRERSSLLDIKPEWRDPAAYRAAQDEMLGVIGTYGFNRVDLDSIMDHRLTKLVWDFSQMKQRIARADARAKEIRKVAKRNKQANRQRPKPQQKEQAKPTGTNEQVAAINDLISNR